MPVVQKDSGLSISASFDPSASLVLYEGDCRVLFKQIPDHSIKLIVTSPPYNIGKVYEKRLRLDAYLAEQREIIVECVRVLDERGSLCWEVGNYINGNEFVPLDLLLFPIFTSLGLRLRNRIVWHFEHGLHCSKRFSGRYETILWFTKTDHYTFNLDHVRVPQKYPQKRYFKGPKAGQLSCHPLGKNPGDVWIIPNVKHNHVEKTMHPCQFPIELVQRLVLAMTDENDWVLDPFIGVGTTAIAGLMCSRKVAGAEIVREYVKIAHERIRLAQAGLLRVRPLTRPVYDPTKPYRDQAQRIHIGRDEPTLFELSSLASTKP